MRGVPGRLLAPALSACVALALSAACTRGAKDKASRGGGDGAGGSTSSQDSSSSGGGGAGGEGGRRPIACPDAYTDAKKGACDLLQQDCGPGKTCIPTEQGGRWTTGCIDGPGLKGSGKPCAVPDECQAGLLCIGSPHAQCTPVCCPSNNAPCQGGICNQRVNFGGAYAWMCSFNPECQLFTDHACESGRDCHISDPTQGLSTCVLSGDAQVDEGQHCTFLNDCKDMQHCNARSQGVCRYYCYLNPPQAGLPPGRGGCPAGQGCTPVDFGVPGVGLCEPP